MDAFQLHMPGKTLVPIEGRIPGQKDNSYGLSEA